MARVKSKSIYYHYGDNFNDIAVVWKDANGTPIDLTDYTSTFEAKDSSGNTVLKLIQGDGLTITAASGRVDLSASPTKMTSSTIQEGEKYSYDWQVKSSDGSVIKTLLKGDLIIDAQVAT